MKVELRERVAWVVGGHGSVGDAVAAALAQNGAKVDRLDVEAATARSSAADCDADMLILVHELRPEAGGSTEATTRLTTAIGETMRQRGSGRIVAIVGALGIMPARRHPEASIDTAATVALVRTLAMRLGPQVLVNAIGVGAIAAPDDATALAAGSTAMLSHIPLARPGAVEDVVNAVLFACDPQNTYMTGQVLTVDGGWSTGYGRNF